TSERLERVWGRITPVSKDRAALIKKWKDRLSPEVMRTADRSNGRALFVQHCAACHKLFGEGGTVGPDLTNTSRADTAWLLASIVDPSAVVRAQYAQYALHTTDGVVRTGIIAEQDGASVTLVDAKGEKTRVLRDRVESLRELPTSLMPEKLLDGLTPQELRDLFAYLQQPAARE
ncbi:MAG TPA: c-type cytochrome, partial [Gemmataceae bacterium]|nr:c-type cytochrome [Gemmataceae bacterium]